MLAETETIATIADHWLEQFEKALAAADDVRLKTLFHPDSHWRDVLALTWQIRTVNGRDAILSGLQVHAARAKPTGFKTDPNRTAARYVTRAGTKTIEAIKSFETRIMRLATSDAVIAPGDATVKALLAGLAPGPSKEEAERPGRPLPHYAGFTPVGPLTLLTS